MNEWASRRTFPGTNEFAGMADCWKSIQPYRRIRSTRNIRRSWVDRVVPLGWPVHNLYGFLIFDLEGYEMSENERRGERSQERTSSPVRLYDKFVPRMRDLRYPLDKLLKGGNQFVWMKQCEEAFNKFKKNWTSDLLLIHYNLRAEIIVATDASSVGLGATISHKFKDGSTKEVQHASRALTNAEAAYSQIDR